MREKHRTLGQLFGTGLLKPEKCGWALRLLLDEPERAAFQSMLAAWPGKWTRPMLLSACYAGGRAEHPIATWKGIADFFTATRENKKVNDMVTEDFLFVVEQAGKHSLDAIEKGKRLAVSVESNDKVDTHILSAAYGTAGNAGRHDPSVVDVMLEKEALLLEAAAQTDIVTRHALHEFLLETSQGNGSQEAVAAVEKTTAFIQEKPGGHLATQEVYTAVFHSLAHVETLERPISTMIGDVKNSLIYLDQHAPSLQPGTLSEWLEKGRKKRRNASHILRDLKNLDSLQPIEQAIRAAAIATAPNNSTIGHHLQRLLSR